MAVRGFSGNYGYSALDALKGKRRIELEGNTYQHRAWLREMGFSYPAPRRDGTRPANARWSGPVPGSNAKASDLLYQLTSRGMTWRAK